MVATAVMQERVEKDVVTCLVREQSLSSDGNDCGEGNRQTDCSVGNETFWGGKSFKVRLTTLNSSCAIHSRFVKAFLTVESNFDKIQSNLYIYLKPMRVGHLHTCPNP